LTPAARPHSLAIDGQEVGTRERVAPRGLRPGRGGTHHADADLVTPDGLDVTIELLDVP
jgi:hypothetical protein